MGYVKILGVLGITLIIFFGYKYVSNLQEDNKFLASEKSKFELANKVLIKEKEQFKKDLETSQKRLEGINKEFTELQKERNEIISIFSDHNFTMLVEKKPGLIQKRMNTKTKEVFKDIENATK